MSEQESKLMDVASFRESFQKLVEEFKVLVEQRLLMYQNFNDLYRLQTVVS